MNYNEAKTLREERARAHAFAVSMLQKVNMTSEDRASYDKAMSEVDRLGEQIKRAENGTSGFTSNYGKNPWTNPREHRRAEAFGRYLRQGIANLTTEQRKLLETRDLSEGNIPEQIGSYSSLGYFVPQGFVYDVEQATKYFAPLMDGSVVRILETASGNALPYPTSNDTTQAATIVAEAAPVSTQDVTANHIDLAAWKLSSGLVKLSMELMQDSAFNLEAWLAERFGERYGRGLEGYLTTGEGPGSGQPSGLLPEISASGATPVIAQGSSESTGGSQTGVNSIGYSDLVNLEHSVDPTYRRNAKYMFHDNTLSAIKRILDKFGRPLWAPGISVGEPSTINGYPYVINQAMPQIAASATTVIFGDFSKFLVRRVKDLSVRRLDELFIVNGQIGFISFARVDSRLIDAGTHPLNVLSQHS